MKLRTVITIDIDAADFVEAAGHQRQLEMMLREIQKSYPRAVLEFRERRISRRDQVEPRQAAVTRSQSRTGRLNTYVD